MSTGKRVMVEMAADEEEGEAGEDLDRCRVPELPIYHNETMDWQMKSLEEEEEQRAYLE